MKAIFDSVSQVCCKEITKKYSTSFSLAIKLLAPSIRKDIYTIYGFVRCADEIVDTFLEYNQAELFTEFEVEYHKALDRKISINPVLNAFQEVVHRYQMKDLVIPFLQSMRLDLHKKNYLSQKEYEQYIYGSADVVGLMCLLVFVKGDKVQFENLKTYAMKLGSAFQKVNFLRDLQHDYQTLGRVYFPNINLDELNSVKKQEIINDINQDFVLALEGIKLLPKEAKFGVYTAYKYYKSLLNKIQATQPEAILQTRIRVDDWKKVFIIGKSYVRYQLNYML